ncbi:hypothetical protein NQ318_009636 [Aromia moschata]|uniref:Uncharacterized protein n=1 Tax=Aromia moschata TaxID=1265417 RepID=A0AAV8Y993_9CUCU|nr:hypothetical protein NQ318_009636 [Aromia moschata]
MCPKTNKLFCFICLVMGGNRSAWTQEGCVGKEGRETTEDDPRPGRPSTSKTDENIEKIGKLIREDRRLSIRGLVEITGIEKECVEAVKAKATEVLSQLTEADFQHCFQQCKNRMEWCRDRQWEYIEGENVATIIGNE